MFCLKKAIKIVNEGNLGIQKVKELLRDKVYWENIDRDFLDQIGKCVACRAVISRDAPPIPMTFSELPPR